MRIGYACIALGTLYTTNHTCVLKNYTEDKVKELIKLNLDSLYEILKYNIKNKIYMFRISSEIIPFGSHPINKIEWEKIFEKELSRIGSFILKNNIRISMHPGHFTILNSPSCEVLDSAISDLFYHSRFLDSIGVGSEAKLILHVGGVYSDKKAATKRWIEVYKELDQNIKKRIVLENDEKFYGLSDVLSIYDETGVPIVYDVLHDMAYTQEDLSFDYKKSILAAIKTWKGQNIKPKIHYSNQDQNKKRGAHSKRIDSKSFIELYDSIHAMDIDIMLEVKDKELSAIKCIQLIEERKNTINNSDVYKEFQKYKYCILQRNEYDYFRLKDLLDSQKHGYVSELYIELDRIMSNNCDNFLNASELIIGELWDKVNKTEIKRYETLKKSYKEGQNNESQIRNFLYKISIKYGFSELVDSYYNVLL